MFQFVHDWHSVRISTTRFRLKFLKSSSHLFFISKGLAFTHKLLDQCLIEMHRRYLHRACISQQVLKGSVYYFIFSLLFIFWKCSLVISVFCWTLFSLKKIWQNACLNFFPESLLISDFWWLHSPVLFSVVSKQDVYSVLILYT